MLGQHPRGWTIAREAAAAAGGGATCVLDIPTARGPEVAGVERLLASGWEVHFVSTGEALPMFARAFARARFGEGVAGGPAPG